MPTEESREHDRAAAGDAPGSATAPTPRGRARRARRARRRPDGADSATAIEVRSPYDGRLVAVVHRAGAAGDRGGDRRAVQAFEETRRLPSWRRAEILERIADAIAERRDELARTIALEAGKPIKTARIEVERASFTFRVAAEETKRIYGEIVPLDWAARHGGPHGPRPPRPARPDRRHLALQLPAQPRRAQGRAGARGRQPDHRPPRVADARERAHGWARSCVEAGLAGRRDRRRAERHGRRRAARRGRPHASC